MKNITRLLIAVSGISLSATFFLPIWQIILEAPQFPEGLNMLIWTNKLTGNIDTINGLNHYIGMPKITAASFPEFVYLPVLMGFFLIFGVITSLVKKKSIVYIYSSLLIVFAIVAMADFYMWEYHYGHDLDPHAPIKLDNMSFQPPLLGYKQIANFLAGSFPAIGGAFFILSVTLAVIALAIELNLFKKKKTVSVVNIITIFTIFMFTACNKGDVKPAPINFGTDECNNCKMTISDKKYGAEIITGKGKVYKFDDIGCMQNFEKGFAQQHSSEKLNRFVIDFNNPATFIVMDSCALLKGSSMKTPMASGLISFSSVAGAQQAQKEYGGELITERQIN